MTTSSSFMGLKPSKIAEEIRKGKLTVCIVGLGWMGLPTACLFAEAGANVIGVDINPRAVEILNKGESHLSEPSLKQLVKKHIGSGRLVATTNLQEAASKGDVIIIVVPTMIDRQKKPDYSAVEDASREIGKGLRAGSMVIFESTCGPRVTETIVKETLEKHSGLKAAKDFGLAYSPIRATSGRILKDLQEYPRVVGAIDEYSMEAACAVLSTVVKGGMIKTRDMRTAEATKLFESVYRDLNIALANDFAIFCEEAGIDYVKAMEAANTQPYSHLHFPGVGVGGHCLPVYPYLLTEEAKALGVKMALVKQARRINENMPKHALRLTAQGLRACGKALARAKVTVLGIAYRANAKETRYSPAVELISLLKRRGSRVTVYDPNFSSAEMAKMGYSSEPNLRRAIEKADCLIITVAHDEFKQLNIRQLSTRMAKSSLVVDCAQVLDPSSVEKTGLTYRGVGRGTWSK